MLYFCGLYSLGIIVQTVLPTLSALSCFQILLEVRCRLATAYAYILGRAGWPVACCTLSKFHLESQKKNEYLS